MYYSSSRYNILNFGTSSIKKTISMTKASSILIKLGCLTLFSLFASSPVLAQEISADGTTNTTVTSPDNSNFEINEGDRAGNNLYHSFGNFSVPNGGSANFNNAPDVENIINRVTGGSVSDINGLIKANGSANLFLINPAGIIFGENARLDIGGSFLGSTADSLSFIDGTEFSATNTQTKPLLTINAPIGLNLRDNPQPITNNSATGLQVKGGKNISLVGGNLEIDRGKLIAPGGKIELGSLSGAGTVGLRGDGSLSFPVGVQRGNITLNNEASVNVSAGGGGSIALFANNLNMSRNSSVEAGIAKNLGSPTAQAGNINVDATGSVLLEDGSRISSNTDGDGNAGKVTINASDTVSVDGKNEQNGKLSSIESTTSGGKGNAGEVALTAKNLFVTNFGQIGANSFGEGDGGKVKINASDSISIDGSDRTKDGTRSSIATLATSKGNAGEIDVTTNNLSIANAGQISADNFGVGNGGNIVIKAGDRISVEGDGIGDFIGVTSIIRNEVKDKDTEQITRPKAIGNAGDIFLTTKNLSVNNVAQVSAANLGEGNAGNVKIDASEEVSVSGNNKAEKIFSGITTLIGGGGKGKAGEIDITTKNLSITDLAQIGTANLGDGDGGKIRINASDRIIVDGSFVEENNSIISTSSTSIATSVNGIGKAGDIDLTTKGLSINNGGQISADNFGVGNAGNIAIDATDEISVQGNQAGSYRGITSMVREATIDNEGNTIFSPQGTAGEINIKTKNLFLTNVAQVSASNFGIGNAGKIAIDASESIRVDGNNQAQNLFSGITSGGSGPGTGNAGEVNISTRNLFVTDVAQIGAGNFKKGDGGLIKINASDNISVDGRKDKVPSSISSGVAGQGMGKGGVVDITTKNLSITNGAQIGSIVRGQENEGNVIIGYGNAGNVKINASDTITVDGSKDNVFSSIATEVEKTGKGNAGGVNIFTRNLFLTNGGRIGTGILGEGDTGGNINLNFTKRILMRNGGTK
jgi:filamentous hemagglutinin family protein